MQRVGIALLLWLAIPTLSHAEHAGDEATARRHYEAGAERYEAGEYRAALEEFLTSQRLFRVPAFDYNIARCYEHLHELAPAIEYYQRYASTDSPEAPRVREHLVELRAEVERTRPKPALRSHRRRNLAIVFGVLGGALVVGTAVALGVSLSRGGPEFSSSTLGPMRVTP